MDGIRLKYCIVPYTKKTTYGTYLCHVLMVRIGVRIFKILVRPSERTCKYCTLRYSIAPYYFFDSSGHCALFVGILFRISGVNGAKISGISIISSRNTQTVCPLMHQLNPGVTEPRTPQKYMFFATSYDT